MPSVGEIQITSSRCTKADTSSTDNNIIQIQFASKHNVPFMATGGGHGYSSTLHSCKNGIDIDLGFFHDIKIDKEASTITIGGSVKFGELIQPLFDVGKEIRKTFIA